MTRAVAADRSEAIEPQGGAGERLAEWAGRHVDDGVRRLLRALFSRRPLVLQTPEELDRSYAMLHCYTDPEVLRAPDRLLAPPAVLPEPIVRARRATRGGRELHLEFASPYRPIHPLYAVEYRRYDRLDRVHLFCWQHTRPAPASLVVTHGWGLGAKRVHELEFGIPWFFRELGLDVYYYVAPYHWLRKPTRARFSGELHPSPNLMRTNEAFVQTAIELRTVLGLVKAHNPAAIGMMGSSLGGYTTALLASLDDRLDFAVPVLPMASLADLFWEHGEADPMRALAESMGMTRQRFREAWALHSPITHSPKVPWEGRLIVSATGDRLVGEPHTEQLWEHWDRPRRVRFAGGHILQVYRAAYRDEVARMLGRLDLVSRAKLARLGL